MTSTTSSGPALSGFRFVLRRGEFLWTHPATREPDDLDCTDLSDEAFEAIVRDTSKGTAHES